jgi:GntR family transcriptional regulator/MocR family aminotransferase
VRSALADYLARARGVVTDPELLVVCAGFSHALSLLARVLRRRGVRVMAMEDPCLRWHRDVVATAGLDVVPIEVDDDGARTQLLDDTDAGAVVLAPAHQFPLGVVLSPERRAAAIAWARNGGGFVIEDDYDAELRYDRTPIGALQSLDPDRVAFTGTVTKSLAPGLRLGWMVVPELSSTRWSSFATRRTAIRRSRSRSHSRACSARATSNVMSGACATAIEIAAGAS